MSFVIGAIGMLVLAGVYVGLALADRGRSGCGGCGLAELGEACGGCSERPRRSDGSRGRARAPGDGGAGRRDDETRWSPGDSGGWRPADDEEWKR